MFNEKRLIELAKNGDEASFEQLLQKYEKLVYTIAYRSTGNEHDAFDISQEVFIKIYKNLPQFKEQSSLSTWIFRITMNACVDFARKKKRTPVSISIDDDENIFLNDIADNSSEPLACIESMELADGIQQAILSLSDDHRKIVILRDITGLSYAEIGEILDMPEGTVKSRLSRARENLRKILLANGTMENNPRLNNQNNENAQNDEKRGV